MIRMALTSAPLAATVAIAAEVDEGEIVVAAARQETDGRYRFSVTLPHADTGLDHSADKWDVVAPGGRVLGARRGAPSTRTSSRSLAAFRAYGVPKA